VLDRSAESKAKQNIYAADSKEEESRDESESADVMGENCCPDENLHETQNASTVVAAEDRNEIIEEPRGPPDFRKQQEDALEYDEEVIDDSEHGAAGLKGYSAVLEIIALIEVLGTVYIYMSDRWDLMPTMNGVNVSNHNNNGGAEGKEKGKDREETSNVEANENVCARWQHHAESSVGWLV